MFDYGYDEAAIMNLRDSIKGIVKGQNSFGLYINLKVGDETDNEYGEFIPAFGYWSGKVPKGTKVICSVKRWARDNKDLLVSIDSVEYDNSRKIVA